MSTQQRIPTLQTPEPGEPFSQFSSRHLFHFLAKVAAMLQSHLHEVYRLGIRHFVCHQG